MNAQNRIVAMLAAGTAALALAGSAMAVGTFTTVNAPTVGGEKNHAQLLSQVYGGTWTSSNGIDYTNGTFTATRLADAGVATPTSLTTGVSGTDDVWTGPATTSVIAKAKYAADNSMFGYFNDTGTDHSFHALFNTSDTNATAAMALSSAFRWGLQDMTTGKMWTSHSADQVNGSIMGPVPCDMLATYKITRVNGETPGAEWALFWEDHGPGQVSDRDFNDAVITIGTVSGNQTPTPGAASLLGVGGLGLVRRKRR